MKLVVPTEIIENEHRVGITPDCVGSLIKMGFKVFVQSNAGMHSSYSDEDYKKSGAKISSKLSELYTKADVIVKIQRPVKNKKINEFSYLKNTNILTLLYEQKFKTEFNFLKKLNVNVFALERMPRISRAQSMDVLSSQSNLSGYKAVIDSASIFNKAFPLMMTSAGTVAPAKVLVIGAGVAGLQAIATAKRLGAVVSSFDVRSSTKEQVESLGAKFIEVKGKDSGETSGGYAKEMSKSYKKKQGVLLAENLKKTDIVITTALIPGKPSPKIITKKMVDEMKIGSVIMDLASEFGGNCELTKHGEIVSYKSKKIIGPINLPSSVAQDSSRLFSKNVLNFLMNSCIDGKFKNFNWEDEVVKETCIINNLKKKEKK
ncbi:MAG: NAD(P)(+) transhydrogenase (Re/Si-specific) subunit alpha [Alphaproteobacteria bacterium]|nr:NAD(P)(+) transhydrogenase (Re/Si-specific) subunit alpha [Alphaproteobacteria bacterium]